MVIYSYNQDTIQKGKIHASNNMDESHQHFAEWQSHMQKNIAYMTIFIRSAKRSKMNIGWKQTDQSLGVCIKSVKINWAVHLEWMHFIAWKLYLINQTKETSCNLKFCQTSAVYSWGSVCSNSIRTWETPTILFKDTIPWLITKYWDLLTGYENHSFIKQGGGGVTAITE